MKLAAESKPYADELKGKINSYGLEISELALTLQGQLVAVHLPYDIMFDGFAPDEMKGIKSKTRMGCTAVSIWSKASQNWD